MVGYIEELDENWLRFQMIQHFMPFTTIDYVDCHHDATNLAKHDYEKYHGYFVWPGGYVSDYVVTIVNPNEAGEVEEEDGHYESKGNFHI